MFWKRKKILFDKPDNSDVPNKLNGGDMTSYVWKTKDEIKRAFFWPDLAQRFDEEPVPFEYFFALRNNFSARFISWPLPHDSLLSHYAMIRYVYELDNKEAEYDQIAWWHDDFVENHVEVAMESLLSGKPLPEWVKKNFFDYLDTDEKKRTMYNAYLYVRAAILTHQHEIEQQFGTIASKDLNDYSLLFA